MDRMDVVVGVDGSEASLAALRWAASEAELRGAALQVLVAYQWRWQGLEFAATGELEDAARQYARSILDEAIGHVRASAPDLTVRGDAVLGSTAQLLIELSRDVGLTVVGSRGRGGFAGLLLGSVGAQVAAHAHGPVVVVRGRSGPTTGTADDPVVVGVDCSTHSADALAQAFEEAYRRGCALVATTAYTLPPAARGVDVATLNRQREAIKTALREDQWRAVAGWRDRYPDVPVTADVAVGGAADVLTTLSQEAQLVVVGSRGHGGFAGLLLGSVGRQLLHHAHCPVLIARARQKG